MSGDGDEVLYAELAGDLRRRSHRAFERIFKEMGPRLYRFAFLPELLQASPCGRYQPDKTYRSLDLYGVPAIRRGRGPVRKGAGLLA